MTDTLRLYAELLAVAAYACRDGRYALATRALDLRSAMPLVGWAGVWRWRARRLLASV